MTHIDPMKFVDICCGGGGASLSAAAAGFEALAWMSMLQRSRCSRPTSLAKTSNLQLPCDKNTLKALFPRPVPSAFLYILRRMDAGREQG